MTVAHQHSALVEVIVATDAEDEECLAPYEVARIREWEASLRTDKTGWWLFAAGCCLVAAFLPLKDRYNNRHNRTAAVASRVALAIAAVGVIAVTAVLVPTAVNSKKPHYGLGKGYVYMNDMAPGITRECVHVGSNGHIHVCRYPGTMGGAATARTGPDYDTAAGPNSRDVFGSSNLTDQQWESIKSGNYALLRTYLRKWGVHEPI